MKKQVEMSIQDENGNKFVAYPKTYKDHVQFDNGMTIDEYLEQDVAMPTVIHEESSIKVGVGDSDVSNSIVDGTIGKMVIKGQTYQNILPKPSLRNKMIGKSMQRLNEGYDNIEVVDGVSKSAILKGNTLVNLNNYNIGYKSSSEVDGTEISFTNNGTYVPFINLMTPYTLKSSTRYTVIFDVIDNPVGLGAVFYHQKNATLGSVVKGIATNRIGLFKFTLDTNEKESDCLRIALSSTEVTDNTKIKNIVILEGDYTNVDIPYFDGMTSVKAPVLKSVGKNLGKHRSNWEANGLTFTNTKKGVSVNGTATELTDYYITTRTGLVNVETLDELNSLPVGTKLILSNNLGKNSYMSYMLNGEVGYGDKITIQNDMEIVGAFVRFQKGDVCKNLNLTIQLEKGTVATPYEPHKSNILSTPEDLELRGIGNVKDTLNLMTGELTQRIGEIVLDGSENWKTDINGAGVKRYFLEGVGSDLSDNISNSSSLLCDKFKASSNIWTETNDSTQIIKSNGIYFIDSSVDSLDAFVNKLKTTNIKVQYSLIEKPVKTVDLSILDQNGGTQENLHSFANGHLQVSSEAENSLLPSVQYEIPTKNSYHMDLMKTNTLYTMKAKTVSGTFTIDGTSYNVNANGTFTSPSSMTDKLLVMSNKTNEEVMLLEGNVIDKTTPYFKGIKSAFEGEDKIEVLSSNCANLFHPKDIVNDNYWELDVTGKTKIFLSAPRRNAVNIIQRDSNGIELMTRVNEVEDQIEILPNAKTLRIKGGCFRPTDAWHELITQNLIVADAKSENNTKEIDYKLNSTKIPLLSPLRSLPNGVYDEIILNRENNNVKMIRRVGEVVLNGEEDWTHEDRWHRWYSSCMNMARANDYATMILNNSENLPATKNNTFLRDDTYGISGYELTSNYPNQNWIYIRPKNVSSTQALQSLLSQNPTTVLYELVTPIITEIDLEGYPYVYKGGHIFLNSEIAPTTQITYNINQSHQIESANENLQRHEKEISRLQKLIAQYIQVEYESTLLSLKI